ncbi:hypothetical protein [Falsiroseomonas sp.]|uniref:hypothetical protein n=1 Tax=Falsiroseomonas sp. TaxID=2870721 RepID=UPI0035655AA7
MRRDHLSTDMVESLRHVFGGANVLAARRLAKRRSVGFSHLLAVAREADCDFDAVAAHFGWLRLESPLPAYGHMWLNEEAWRTGDPRPGDALAGVLDHSNSQMIAGWALCKLVTAPRRRWPPQWLRPLLVRGNDAETERRYMEMARTWRPARLGERPAARH